MKTLILTVWLTVAVLTPAVAAEADCSAPGFAVNNLVQYCELRESTVWYDGEWLRVENEVSGSITVVPWDEPSVQVRAVVVAGAETEGLAQAMATHVYVDTSNGAVVVRGPRIDGYRAWAVRLYLRVPRSTGLVLRTVNGGIEVEDVEGKVSVTNVNGSVALTRVSGDVTVRGVNGSVRIAVNRWRAQTIDVKSTNGGIELDLPQDTAARVDLSLTVGTIRAAIGNSAWTAKGIMRKASFEIGGGGSAIRAELTAGSIGIRVPSEPGPSSE